MKIAIPLVRNIEKGVRGNMCEHSIFYSILFYSILFYSILFYSILFYSILPYAIYVDKHYVVTAVVLQLTS